MIFAGIILSLLWVLQTVFLQRFYDGMMIRNIRSAAEEIAEFSKHEDLDDIIDELSLEDSLLVYITEEDGDVLYSSDSYKSYFRASERSENGREGPDRKKVRPSAGYRFLPDNYDRFLKKLRSSDTGTVGYTEGNSYIYGSRITIDDDDPAVLYVAGTLGAVGAAASIIRVQLLWVTGLSLVIAFVIAWLIARRFSGPIDQLSAQAQMLGSESYEDRFEKGFCRELDELDEAMAQSAEKLSEARDYQKELLANVSHDLRTPLTMIRGYAEMVRDFSWADEEQRNADTADRLTALVNEILEYSRLQEKDHEENFREADLSALTERVIAQFEPLFRNEGGTIEKKITPGCVVSGNEELLERAVYNLIDNAVRHSADKDKRITVTVSREDRVRLDVRDHGEGIDEEELNRIWDKYYTSRQRGNKGSGLGLAIVRQIAAVHHAETAVESRPGEGSVFSLIMNG